MNECKTATQRSEAAYHFLVRCEGQFLHLIHSLQTDRWALQWDWIE